MNIGHILYKSKGYHLYNLYMILFVMIFVILFFLENSHVIVFLDLSTFTIYIKTKYGFTTYTFNLHLN